MSDKYSLKSMRDIEPVKILITGLSGHGKTTSLEHIPEPEGVLYFDLDGKGLPFSRNNDGNTFQTFNIKKAEEGLKKRRAQYNQLLRERKVQDNPYMKMSPSMFLMNAIQEFSALKNEDGTPKFHTFIIDTFSYLMTLFEIDIKKDEYTNKTSSGKVDGQANWGQYKDFVSETLLDVFSGLPQHIICLNHINTDTGVAEVAGSWKHKTIESSFAHIVRSVKIEGMMFDTLKENVKNDLLTYSQRDNFLNQKYAYKVLPHPDFDNFSERTPDGMFKIEFDPSGESNVPLVCESFIDNDIMIYLSRWYEFSGQNK